MDIWYYILTPFTWLLQLFYNITGSYGFALIFFAVVVKLILFPFSLKGKKSMIQMNMLSGKKRSTPWEVACGLFFPFWCCFPCMPSSVSR